MLNFRMTFVIEIKPSAYYNIKEHKKNLLKIAVFFADKKQVYSTRKDCQLRDAKTI